MSIRLAHVSGQLASIIESLTGEHANKVLRDAGVTDPSLVWASED